MNKTVDGKNPFRQTVVYLFLLPALLCATGYGLYQALKKGNPQPEHGQTSFPTFAKGEPVQTNLGSEIAGGFQGDVHPALHGQTTLTLTADWAPVGNGNYASEMMPPEMCAYIVTLKPAIPQQDYSERDFSGFLPKELNAAGQAWTLDPERLLKFLRQFQSAASLNLVAQGRRFGPDGAFAVLRGVSPAHYDIAFRVHAEFDVTPANWTALIPGPDKVWYTPSYFSGRMIVNRQSGTVDYFRMGLATDTTLNVHITAAINQRTMDSHDIVRVDRMELVGGNTALANQEIPWSEELTDEAVYRQLQRAFYKFAEINWLPFEQVQAAARENNKPIFAMVLWGNLDDQSC